MILPYSFMYFIQFAITFWLKGDSLSHTLEIGEILGVFSK